MFKVGGIMRQLVVSLYGQEKENQVAVTQVVVSI
jgi:hypothetical protein